MDSLQWDLEQRFCPLLDSTLIADIVNEYPNFDECYDILSKLAYPDLDLDTKGKEGGILVENYPNSGNSSSISSVPSSCETDDGSVTSLEYSIDNLSIGDESDYMATDYDEYNQFEYKERAEFLKTCFPKFSEKVDTLLKENGYNAEIVSDVILNEDYLKEEQQVEDFAYLHADLPISVRDSNYKEDNSLVSESHYKHRKKKRQKKNIITFQNNGHHSNSIKSSFSNSSINLGLSDFPPLPSTTTSSYQWTSSSSIQLKKPWNKLDYKNQDELIDNKLNQLTDLFPDKSVENLRKILIACKGEVQNAIEMLLSADTSKVWNGSKRLTATLTNNSKIHDNNNSDDIDIYDCDYDYKYCRKEALKYLKKREEAYKKAHESYRKKDGIASYYTDKAKEFDVEMKKWDLEAARLLVKKHSNKINDKHVLDLHGCSVNEALTIVEEWLGERTESAAPLKPLKIITGIGNHSPKGIAKLPDAINEFLVKNNWHITKCKGYVLVHVRG